MSVEYSIELITAAMIITTVIVGPLLMVALVIGLVVGVLQAATQVNEASIAFVAKLIAIGVTIVVLGPWCLGQLVDYTQRSFSAIVDVNRD